MMNSISKLVLLVVVVAFAGCDSAGTQGADKNVPLPTQSQTQTTPLESDVDSTIFVIAPMVVPSPDNCALVMSYPFGGAFEISRIDRDGRGRVMAIDLTRSDDWSRNMPTTIHWDLAERWEWGPDSRTQRPLDYQQLEKLNKWETGQHVGVFYYYDINELEKVDPTDDQRLFVDGGDGAYTNGYMFTKTPTTLEAIGDIMKQGYAELARGEACTVTAVEDNKIIQENPVDDFTYIDEMPPGIPIDPNAEFPSGE